ncbi:MAG: cytochrome b/b6 domain-containing protein [Gemmatimonadetes bacterium]|nr:cytochrome b/b6 domain-containing protein [Gemmatimonadota bacterium]
MDFLRTASNPWGQEILVGIAWDLLWAALFAGIVFVVGHAIHAGAVARKPAGGAGDGAGAPGDGAGDRVERHDRGSRAFHWLMSAAMLTLLVTAFLPAVGIQFAWVTLHWIAGVALILLIVYHVWRSYARQDPDAVRIGRAEIADAMAEIRGLLKGRPATGRTAKYPVDQRAFHLAATVTSLGAALTGVLMMFRIDTWFWRSDPYFLSDHAWGLVFVLHGLCGVALVTLVIAHVYFAIRPEKRFMTRSMIKGWITREEYLQHYDPDKWPR